MLFLFFQTRTCDVTVQKYAVSWLTKEVQTVCSQLMDLFGLFKCQFFDKRKQTEILVLMRRVFEQK